VLEMLGGLSVEGSCIGAFLITGVERRVTARCGARQETGVSRRSGHGKRGSQRSGDRELRAVDALELLAVVFPSEHATDAVRCWGAAAGLRHHFEYSRAA
jgi:hypothetical protein